MNDWGGMVFFEGKYKLFFVWKMIWNVQKGYYEFIKEFGKDGVVIGVKFKFILWDGIFVKWYLDGMGNDKVIEEFYIGNEKIIKVDIFKIIIEDELELQVFYVVLKDGFKLIVVQVRNILDNLKYYYKGNDLGCIYIKVYLMFRFWVLIVIGVILRFYDDYKIIKYKEYEMQQLVNGIWYFKINGNLKGKYY